MTLMDPAKLTNPWSISIILQSKSGAAVKRGNEGVEEELIHKNIGSSLLHTHRVDKFRPTFM